MGLLTHGSPHPPHPNTLGAINQRETPFCRWTNSELQARRDKGLYYWCNKSFSKGRYCKNKELRLYIVADDLEDVATEKGMMDLSLVVKLSLNSVVGLMTPGTFKIKGTMKDRKIIISVDFEATQNFMSLVLVKIQHRNVENNQI